MVQDVLIAIIPMNAHNVLAMMIPVLAQKIAADAKLVSWKLEIHYVLPVHHNALLAQQV